MTCPHAPASIAVTAFVCEVDGERLVRMHATCVCGRRFLFGERRETGMPYQTVLALDEP